MDSLTVDGNDVEAVYAAATEAVARIRTTRKPFLLETYTYRLRGHMEPDDQADVDQVELAHWRGEDPILRMKHRLRAKQFLTDAEIEEMEARAREAMDQAEAFAAASPFPDPAELTTDVYA
jgi:pyruvate dehydrogenase E1 component alpha subunit